MLEGAMIDPRLYAQQLNANVSNEARAAKRITFMTSECDEHTAFAALQGATRHGNDFIEAALEAGSPFILTDLDVPRGVQVPDAITALRHWARLHRDTTNADLIGITGSAGKTTAKSLVSSALNVPCTPGNLNTLNYLACYLLSNVEAGSTHVIEMGIDQIGEMDELMALIAPNIGIITAVGAAHTEFFSTVETVALEKGRILEAPNGMVAGNTAWRYPNTPSYGFLETCTHQATNLHATAETISFEYHGQHIRLETPSTQIAESAVLALALAERYNIPLETAKTRLETSQIPGGRLRIERGKITLIDDAYNANPLSVTASLETLARFTGRKVAILGHMRELGTHSRQYHSQIGATAAKHAQLIIAIGEHGDALAQAALENGADALWYASTEEAKTRILPDIQNNDTILVKGSRFVQLEQIVEVLRERL
jgi:UDP-N-acetylmuramoyl-tripeptide--D-alanyl-D-alanine ligase